MANFGGSFADAFEKSYQTSSNNYSDNVRDKIKQDQLKATEKYKATTVMHSNLAMASGIKDADMAKKVLGIVESVGEDYESQKNIGEMIAKQLAPPTNIYVQGNDGQPLQTGSVPAGSKVFKAALTPEEITARTQARVDVQSQAPTADIKMQKIRIQNQIQNIDLLEKEASELKGGYSGMAEIAKATVTRGEQGSKEMMYMRKLPAMGVSLYRDLTGDTRLSDADAQARALPLLWNPTLSPKLREPMFNDTKLYLEARKTLIQKGAYKIDPETNEPITPINDVILEGKRIKARKAGYSEEEINKFLSGGK